MKELALKYRPKTFDDVVGQDAIVASIASIVSKRSSRAFCLTGPSGTGKTTIARIIATELECKPDNLLEVDAATNTGVDAWRVITEGLRYKPLGGGVKCVIVDEAHMLSKSAWNSLLKDVEEPPAHVWWFFCTTEPQKIPKTIQTRCSNYELASVDEDELYSLMETICAGEDHEIDEDILDLVARQAGGSPRDAINSLAQVWGAEDVKEAAILLRSSVDNGDVINLARALAKGALTWKKAMVLVKTLQGQQVEGIRIVVLAYITKVAMGANSDDQATQAVAVLDAFRDPYPSGSQMAPLIISLGDLLLDGQDDLPF